MGGVDPISMTGGILGGLSDNFSTAMLGKTTPAKVQDYSLLTSQQNAHLSQLLDQIREGKGVQAYQGQTVAGTSPLQQESFNLVNTLLGGGGIYGQGQAALNSLLADFDPAATTDYFNTSVKKPMMRTWEQETLPALREKFIANSVGSSSGANTAIANSGRDLTSMLGETLGNLLYNARESHANRQLSAAGQALPYATTPISAGLTAGQTQRGIEQEQLAGDYQNWAYSQPYNNPWLQYLMQALGLNTQTQVVTPGTQQQGLLGPLLGAAGTIGGAVAGNPALAAGGGLFGATAGNETGERKQK